MTGRMNMLIRATAAVLLGATTAAAQGTADLRYVAPLPSTVVLTSVDSISSTMSGMPMGDLTSSGTVRTVTELRFRSGEGGTILTATLKELDGSMETPMGTVPMTSGEVEPVEARLAVTGLNPEEIMEGQAAAALSSPDAISSQRALSALLVVPGRQLKLGESWTDTTTMSPTVEGLDMAMTVITRGTYEADTVVDGRPLNVLRITSDMTTKTSGTVQGMDVSQDMTAKSQSRVLWDSARHMAVHNDATTETRMESFMAQQGVTLTMTGRTRTIVTTDIVD